MPNLTRFFDAVVIALVAVGMLVISAVLLGALVFFSLKIALMFFSGAVALSVSAIFTLFVMFLIGALVNQ